MESTASEPCPYTEGHRNEQQKDKEYWFGRGRGKCPWMDRFNHTRGVIRAIQLLTGNNCERAHQFLYYSQWSKGLGPTRMCSRRYQIGATTRRKSPFTSALIEVF